MPVARDATGAIRARKPSTSDRGTRNATEPATFDPRDGERYRQMLVDADADSRFQQLRAQVKSVRFADNAECAKLGLSAVVAPAGTARHGTLLVIEAETLRLATKAALDGNRPERE